MTRKGRKRKLDSEETSLTEWETRNLMSDKVREEMKTIWEIPQIFHFLHLTKKVLSIGNLSMYEMERMLLIPRASKQLAHIMTCLLSPPGLKTKLRRIPPMPYEYWTNILFHKIKSWFKIYHGKREDTVKVLESIGVEPGFWQIFPDVSSLEGQDFEELTFRQRVWLLKTICDTMMHTRKTVQEEMSKQMTEEQSEMLLGTDRYGARYVYLPQILENDIRVYRHCLDNKILSTVKAPVIKLETGTEVKVEIKKEGAASKPGKTRRRKSRWRNGALPSRMRKRIKRQEDALLQKSNASPLSIENIPSRATSTCSDDVESGCSKQSDISCISKSSNSSEDTIISTETECLRSKSSGYGTNTPNDFKSNDEISLSEVFHGFPKNVNDSNQHLLEKAAMILDTNSDAGSSVDFQNDSSKRFSNEKTKNDEFTQNVQSTETFGGKSEKQPNLDTAASVEPQTQVLSTSESETTLNIVDEAGSHLGIKLSSIREAEVMPNSGVHPGSESELDPMPNPEPEIALNTESEVNLTLEQAVSSNSEPDIKSNSDAATMSNYDSATALNCDTVPTSGLESTKTPKPNLEVTFDPETNVTTNVESQETLTPTSDMISNSNSNAMLHLHKQDNGKSDVKFKTASISEEELGITSEINKLNSINVKIQDVNENDTQLTKSKLMSDSKDNGTKVMVKPVDADISLEEVSCSSKTDDEKLNERMSNDDAYKIQGVHREGSNREEILFVSKSDDEKLIETKLKDSTSYDDASLEQQITESTSGRSSMKPMGVPDSENILSVLKEADGKWLRNRLVRNDPEETSKSDRSSSTFGEDSLTDIEMNRASPDLPVWERYNLRKPKMMKKEEIPQEEIVNFDELLKDLSVSKFELIADSVEGLRDVVAGMTAEGYNVTADIPLSKRSRPQCETKLINKMLDLIASLEKRESAFNDATKKARAKLHKEWNNFKEGVVEDQDWSSDGSLGLGFNWWVIGSQGCHLLPPASDATISTLSQATVPQPDANHRQTRSSDRTNQEQPCDEQTQKNDSEKQQQQSSSSGCDDRDAQNECEQSDNREQDESLAQYKESGGESDAGSRRVLRTRGVSSYTEQIFTSDEDVDENELERWTNATPKHTLASSSPTTPVTPGPSTSEQVEVWQSEDSDQDWILPSSRKRKNRRSVGRKLKSLQQKLQYISGESEEQTSPTKLVTPLKSTSVDVCSGSQDSLTPGSITDMPNPSNLNSISSDSIKSNWDSENLGNDLNNSKADSTTSITKIDSLECSQAVPSSPICKIANVESIHSEIDIKDEITSNDQTTSISNYHLNMQSGGYVVVKTEQGPMSNYYIMSQAPPIPTTIIPPNAAMPNMMPQRYYIQSPQNYNVMSQQPNFINHQHHERPQLMTHPHAVHPNYVQMHGPSPSYVMQPQMQQIQHQIQPMHPQMQPMNPQMYQPIQQHHLTPRGYYISQSPRGNIVMPPQSLRMMHHGRPTVIRNGMSFPHGAVIRSSLPIRPVGPRTNGVPRRNASTQQHHSDARTKKYGKKVLTKNATNLTTSLIVLSDSDDEIEMIVAGDKSSEKCISSKPTPNEAQSREKPTVTSHVAVSASNNALPPQIIQRMSQGGISITPVKAPQQQPTLQNPNTQLVVVVNETGSHYALSLPNGSKLILTNEQVAQIRASNGGKLML